MIVGLKRLGAAVWFAAVLTVSPAVADTVVSTSNNPTLALGESINRLVSVETQSLSGLRSNRLKQMVTPHGTLPPTDKRLSRDWIDAQPVVTGGAEWACLTEALYFEARGESIRGMTAVAEVILNRVDTRVYPDTVCAVVNQGTGERYRCQFTYTCDGRAETITEPRAYDRVGKIAKLMLDGAPRTLTGGATYYHTKAVSPRWSRVFDRTVTIDDHHFYVNPVHTAALN
ncbi:MAG: cell wall hydrolase [Pseudomonadota bacterium]